MSWATNSQNQENKLEPHLPPPKKSPETCNQIKAHTKTQNKAPYELHGTQSTLVKDFTI